jgi:hypothetical protein
LPFIWDSLLFQLHFVLELFLKFLSFKMPCSVDKLFDYSFNVLTLCLSWLWPCPRSGTVSNTSFRYRHSVPSALPMVRDFNTYLGYRMYGFVQIVARFLFIYELYLACCFCAVYYKSEILLIRLFFTLKKSVSFWLRAVL